MYLRHFVKSWSFLAGFSSVSANEKSDFGQVSRTSQLQRLHFRFRKKLWNLYLIRALYHAKHFSFTVFTIELTVSIEILSGEYLIPTKHPLSPSITLVKIMVRPSVRPSVQRPNPSMKWTEKPKFQSVVHMDGWTGGLSASVEAWYRPLSRDSKYH